MIDFVTTYLATAAANPRAGFAMLTPRFKAASRGFHGYRSFWGNVTSVRLHEVHADPATLMVSYEYSYRYRGEPRTDPVTLRLKYSRGTYLIAAEM